MFENQAATAYSDLHSPPPPGSHLDEEEGEEEDNNRMMTSSASEEEHHPAGVEVDEDGLILPKKLYNPCLQSKYNRDLNHQIRWNAKTGINPLEKSELEMVMAKRNRASKERQAKQEEAVQDQTPFQKMLQERAQRLERLEREEAAAAAAAPGHGSGSEDSGHCSPEPENEFLKVHAKLLGDRGGSNPHSPQNLRRPTK